MISSAARSMQFSSRRSKRAIRFLVLAGALGFFFVSAQMLLSTPTSEEDSHKGDDPLQQEQQHALAVESDGEYKRPADMNAKIDWTDYKKVEEEKQRTGPGENGMGFHLPADKQRDKETLYRTNGFNALASDFIALNRSVRDIRHKDCRKKKYLSHLPTVSVILPFHNEHWTTLLRSVYSILDRSPPQLLKEVILADDYSNKPFLGKQLDDYIAKQWPDGKVKVVRATQREGLIRARLMGARIATAQVLLFLDSHSECNVNWLPPLLEPIAEDRRTAVCPFVDVIDFETFEYRAQDEGARGAFDWELYYKRLPLLPESLKRPTEPFDNPVMAGGYFAIDSKWFWELGGYDEGLDIWGGEQYELSFKIWQCGGRMVDAPCSRVGHIYRKFSPFPSAGKGDFIGRNYKRVAEVWMDDYKEFIYQRRPHYRSLDPGDISKQVALRDKLQCKPFRWFMTEIAFDLVKKYPPVEVPPAAEGDLRSAVNNLCIDTKFHGQNERFELAPCLRDNPSHGGEQNLVYGNGSGFLPASLSVSSGVVAEIRPIHSQSTYRRRFQQAYWGVQPMRKWMSGRLGFEIDAEGRVGSEQMVTELIADWLLLVPGGGGEGAT
uniref:Glycosyltransferase 2-like domain-containing protein n=1 Tax=Plectus sambesii TaxID=2011161 RepID=A0A914XP32_9BILA